MNTAALKTFAIRARNLLMEGVSLRLAYWGFTEGGGTPAETVQPAQGGYIFRRKVYDEADVPQKWAALRDAIATTSFSQYCGRN